MTMPHLGDPAGKINGKTGEVTRDGRRIAALVEGRRSRLRVPRGDLILLDQRPGWVEVGRAEMGPPESFDLWLVRFWDDWLVVGVADRVWPPAPADGHAREDRLKRRIRFFDLADMRLRTETVGERFVSHPAI